MNRFGLVAVGAALLVIMVLTGCKSDPALTAPAYADSYTEKLLLAFDANDYRAYLENFDAQATGSVDMDLFKKLVDFDQIKIGNYVAGSKVLQQVIPIGNYTQVTYKAQYTKEPNGVTVIIDFNVTDSGTYVAGVFINSPNMFK